VVQEAEDYVSNLLSDELPESYSFHNMDHARYVVKSAEYIGKECGLTEQDLNVLKIAAWFHDVGYIRSSEDHEEESALMAADFLSAKGVDTSLIEKVQEIIMSTSIPQIPVDLISKVMCDADLRHLGEEDYFDIIENLRIEFGKQRGKKLGRRKFYKMSVKFFKDHNYHTEFAKKNLQPTKEKNFKLLQNRIIMLEEKKAKKQAIPEPQKLKGKGYSRGVESMFRLTARNQINLSSIADNKSNILISVNAIMMSITMTVLVTRFEEVPNIILPTLIFLVSCLITIIFAILSTRPNISGGTFNMNDIKQNKVNLLFFGNFYNMKLDEYEWAIEELMNNDKNLYKTMIKDQFALGEVLAKKYKLLRKAYNVFMVGIIISVIAFVLAFINI
jgi:predicted metal-dependent HD superfamily phosphohydrolase